MAQCVSFTVEAQAANIVLSRVTMSPTKTSYQVGETIYVTAYLSNSGNAGDSTEVYFLKGTEIYSTSALLKTVNVWVNVGTETKEVELSYVVTEDDAGSDVKICATITK